jgi:hypothetical protein
MTAEPLLDTLLIFAPLVTDGPPRRLRLRLTPIERRALLRRGEHVCDELFAAAVASLERLAAIPDDDGPLIAPMGIGDA